MSADNDREELIVDGSGNVFADLGLPHDDDDMFKVQIALAITNVIRDRKLTQEKAAQLVGTDQAKISAILRGKLKGLSSDRLIRFLVQLGPDVELRVRTRSTAGGPGKIRVYA